MPARRAPRGAAALLVSAALAPSFVLAQQAPLRLRLEPVCASCAALADPARPAVIEAILSVQVNLEAKGEYPVLLAQDGDVLVRASDLPELGLAELAGERSRIEGVDYVALRALEGVEFSLDAERLVLAIRVDPRRLARRQVLDFGPSRSAQVLRPEPAGSFFNYNVTHTRADESRDALDAAGELGVRLGSFLFLSDGYSTQDPVTGERRNTRLSTSLVRDRRERMERLAFGDFLTVQPGPLASSLRLGGVSLSRRFSIDPYYVRFPGQVVTGTAALPSEVFVYSNGVLIRRERVGPGGFELQNLVNLPGLQTTEVVVRDVLGNESRIVDPFYYSESLLRTDVDEYSVDFGFERRHFGVRSGDYGKPGFASFYRRGLSPAFTLGAHLETLEGRTNAGPSASWGLGSWGVFSAGFAASRGARGSGGAVSLAHAFQSERWSTNVALRSEARDFARAAAEAPGNRRYDFAAFASHALSAGSSVSLGVTSSAPWETAAQRSIALGYRVRAARDVYLSATATHSSGARRDNELLFTLSWHFDAAGQRNLASVQARRAKDSSGGLLQLSGGNPEAEGLVYRVSAEQSDDSAGDRRVLNPALQWNARHAVMRAESFHDSRTKSERSQLGVQGGVAAVGGEWAVSRPITDSFAIVKVGPVPGVRVYASNQQVGTTDASGTVFVPRLASYFENPVAIEDRDLPLNYLVREPRFIVSPGLRSGVLIDFGAHAVTAVAGRLVMRRDGATRAFGDAQGEVTVGAERRELMTAKDGSFYLEQLAPGKYEGLASRGGEQCRFRIDVKASEEVVTELGEVACAP